ncbi:L-seryl-tRNA(Sec) selenium transferase [compost metagenome]
MYVVSHHTVQSGLIGLADYCSIAAEYGIPVIVDAASEYDLMGFIAAGAQLVIYSGHKFLGGPTSGIIAGEHLLVRACYMQEKGIGRGMKVGKESIVGVMEALEQWLERDSIQIRQSEETRIDYAFKHLNRLKGILAHRVVDPTDNPITRLQVAADPHVCGLSASHISQLLASGNPSIRVRDHEVELGYFQIDPCNLIDGEIELLCNHLEQLLINPTKPNSHKGNSADLAYEALLLWPNNP